MDKIIIYNNKDDYLVRVYEVKDVDEYVCPTWDDVLSFLENYHKPYWLKELNKQ